MKKNKLKNATKWKLPLYVLLLLVGISAYGQKTTITGVISSTDDGMPLLGANVLVKGTTIGVVSDFDGNYSISAPSDATTLVFSYIGFKTKEVAINGQTAINVSLELDAAQLDEVVIIGYGTSTKRKMVGAVSTLDTEKLEQTPYMNVGEALQGQVAGLIVQNNGGGPGASPSVSIRGGGSPLYVIDGVILGEQDFNAINSNDIESISFLKDASATAVYGSRAGNGIVLVTTKRGKDGKMNINYSYNYQISEPTILPEQMNSYQYAQVQNRASAYEGLPVPYSDAQLETIRTHADLDTYPDNNWLDLTLKNFAPEQRHNLSLNGGNEKANYFVSLGYVDQGGILKEDVVNYERFNIRSNLTSNFEKLGLEVGLNVNASLEKYQEPYPGMFSIWRAVNQNTSALYRGYNLDGTLAGGGNGDNPLALIDPDAGYNRTRDKFINTQLSLKWQVPGVEGLKLGAMANYRDGDGWGKLWEYNVPLYMQDGSIAPQKAPALSQSSYYNTSTYLETSISYGRTFGVHGIDATFVYNRASNFAANLAASRRDYISGAVDQLFAGPAIGKDNDGSEREGANAGYVFRLKYDYDYKYILELSGRYDGNDNFSEKKRWGFFPAFSFAWNVTEEDFMQSLKEKNIINSLKLRSSYGKTGVTQGVNRFGYIPVYNLEASAYTIGDALVNGYSEGNLVKPDELTWYTRESFNYGLDFSSMGDKLSGTIEYFNYKTTGFLVSPKNVYSQPLGKDLPQVRSNSAQRRAGFELGLRYKGGKGTDFQYEVGANYSYFDQLWEQLDTEDQATLYNPYTRQTHRTDYWQGGAVYQTDGLYQGGQDLINNPRLLGSTQTQGGDIRYVDSNGDGKVDEQDKRLLGKSSIPHGTYGIDFKLKYKGWSMSGLFQGTGDRYIGFDRFIAAEAKRLTYVYQLDYWTPDNPNALYPRPTTSVGVNGGNNDIISNPSDYFLKNAKYFRLKNLQLGYDFKKTLLADAKGLSTFRMFINGTNLFTVSPVKDFFDPEQVQGNAGIVGYGYPVQRTYSLGLTVGF
ncbi:MAG: TonB-dependent receptor [Cellulophaga sp.]|uniref:SusC/RagA family TonB-linked outer membrane protein n=1 Tax=unclassified Cellulophaga TaxID=2634405 RepID=UPI000C2C5A20|nr:MULTISPECIES: TonB-dependent receptor [unclassified Cellulophaga]MDO6492396.1 TonB-dependent receptor [Cellulophaga sp. 2_MG-2023]MDO6496104.1 TonB-dependent receptor [Cellulophaga sp. 3_MG-2023]PKB44946.1 TonB-linked SusC/RagA family outer membrane protein [Cellulophaga sp. RHA19]